MTYEQRCINKCFLYFSASFITFFEVAKLITTAVAIEINYKVSFTYGLVA